MRLVTVVGNRPQFVKAAAVSRALAGEHDEVIVHTGQHYDDEMSRVFFEELGVPAPARELGCGGGSNSDQTARMLAALGPLIDETAPELVVVYGDTNSTLAGALAGAQARRPVAHVEAGMRSFDRAMPEELNRVLVDHASDLLLCSTPTAVANLEAERAQGQSHLVGDVMVDVTLAFRAIAQRRSDIRSRVGLPERGYAVVTAHRAGTVDDPDRLQQLVAVLEQLPLPAVFPVHPRTAARLEDADLRRRLEAAEHVRLEPPLGYLDFLELAAGARAIVTDSGGIQKEALVLGVPCVTLRDTTEWVETVDSGWNVLVGLDPRAVAEAVMRPAPEGDPPDLYGGGRAAERVRDVLAAYTPTR